jgi:hypothetical protein
MIKVNAVKVLRKRKRKKEKVFNEVGGCTKVVVSQHVYEAGQK